MKRLCAFLLLLVMLGTVSGALASAVTFENLHYGQEAFEMHMNNETNSLIFQGETYSLDDDAVAYEDKLGLYGGKTRAVYEMTVPSNRFSVEADGQETVLGEWIIDIPYRAELWIAEGNRISGEYVVQGPLTLTDVYWEQITLPRNTAGNPLLIDRIYLYRYAVGDVIHRSAAMLYIDYEGYCAARPGSALAAPSATETTGPVKELSSVMQTPFLPIVLVAAALCVITVVLVLHQRTKREPPCKPYPPIKLEPFDEGRFWLENLKLDMKLINDETLFQKAEHLYALFEQLLSRVQEKPQKPAGLKRYTGYYMPLAGKLLLFWHSIESSETTDDRRKEAYDSVNLGLDLMISACQKQLNELHDADILDISTDISALEQILKREGISGPHPIFSYEPPKEG